MREGHPAPTHHERPYAMATFRSLSPFATPHVFSLWISWIAHLLRNLYKLTHAFPHRGGRILSPSPCGGFAQKIGIESINAEFRALKQQ